MGVEGWGGGAHVRTHMMTSLTYLWVALRFATNSYFEPQSEQGTPTVDTVKTQHP
jgi:hypothetical protein